MTDAHKNFATSLVATAPSPASSGTTLDVTTGEGGRFPVPPFNAVVCPAGANATPANAEIVRITGMSADHVSAMIRQAEGTNPRSIVVGDRIFAGATAKMLTDIESIPQSVLEVYVDYVNGSDSNNGRSWASAYKTIQAAYDALKTYALANYTPDANGRFGIGRIHLAPGDHNVGAGLAFDNRYAVEVLGTRSGRANHDMPNTASRIVSTSTTATEMVRISSGTGVIGLGFVFNNVAFRVDDTAVTGNVALTKVIWVTSVGHLRVERCSFGTVGNSANLAVTAIYHEDITTSSGEAGWVRVIANNCSRMQLYKATTTTGAAGGNFNRGRIRDNVVLYGHATMPMIHLNADTNGYLVDNNNLEGTATGLELSTGAFTTNTFLNNSGEDSSTGTPPNPFYKVSGSCSGQLFIGGVCTTGSASGAGTWIDFAHANAYNNLVIGPYDANGVTSAKRKIVDSSTANGNVLLHTNHRIAVKYKSTATALADSDFTTGPPPNGTLGLNSAGTLYGRAAGAWSPISGAGGGSGPVSVVVRTADSSHINSGNTGSTLTNDNTLLWAVAGNGTEIWFFECFLIVNTANTAMDIKLGWSVPSGTTMTWGGGYTAGGTTFPGFHTLPTTGVLPAVLTAGSSMSLGTASGKSLVGPSGWVFSGGTAGNVNLQIAQVAPDAGDLYLAKGSLIRLTKLVA